jgi:histidine triad (HIT) family protein
MQPVFFILPVQTIIMLKQTWYRLIQLKTKIFGGMTIFSKIINGDIPSYKIAEDGLFYAFLDIFPLVEGHTLVIPKMEIDKFFDLPDDVLHEMLVFAKPIAHAIEQAFPCNRCGISVIGLEVPHAHLHLAPINGSDDLNFTRPKLKMSPEKLLETQKKILRYL